jgi:uracil-DNA glycosylase family 4
MKEKMLTKPDPDILADLNFMYEQYKEEPALRTLSLTATRLVPGAGPLDGNPKLIMVGEAPGSEEDKRGIPFVGRSGQLLDELIDLLWLSRDEVYITNLVKFRPMGNRDPEPEEIETSLPYLRREIKTVAGDCRLIVGLGRLACGAISGGKATPIGKLHGTTFPLLNGFKLFCTYHPSWAMRTKYNKSQIYSDFKKLRTLMDEST